MEEPYDERPYDERPYSHFLQKPMFELFCISIHSKQINDDPKLTSLHDGKPCDIHGIVRVLDQDDNKFDFYNRKINNIETLNLGGFLSLNAFPIVLSKPLLTVAVMLYDTAHNVEIANNVFEIDYRKMYDYDQLHIHKIDGQYGFASVYYTTFQHSMTASINKIVILHNNGGGDSLNHNLFGTVVARLERNYKTPSRDVHNEFDFPPIMLFDNQVMETKSNSTQAVLDLDTPINLLRSYVVVPLNCSLRIEADFCDTAGNKVVMNIQQNVYPASLNKNSVRYQNFEMQIQVTWLDGYAEFPWHIKVEDTLEAIEEECLGPYLYRSRPYLFPFAELFSVLICVDDSSELKIHGTIKIYDQGKSFCVFDGEVTCCGWKSFPVLSPLYSFSSEFFGVDLDVNDEKGRIVSRGFFEWNYRNNGEYVQERNVCSVVMGDIGYAAIHYARFGDCFQARIRVSFVSHSIPNGFVNVFGSITSEYGNYEYPTPYDQEYYTNKLFSKPQDDYVPLNLASGSSLPLLKSLIAVPLDNSLILDVDLMVTDSLVEDSDKQSQEFSAINKLVEFKPNVDGYFVFERSDFVISICVEWSVCIYSKGFTRPILPDKSSLERAMQKVSLNR